jgi:hypothetical protein
MKSYLMTLSLKLIDVSEPPFGDCVDCIDRAEVEIGMVRVGYLGNDQEHNSSDWFVQIVYRN